MFRCKVCGITSVDDAQHVVQAGADALGLNFYRPSPRFVEPKAAAEIVAAIPSSVAKVGLFVNASTDEISSTFDQLALDLIQLHGDEPPEFLAALGERPVMRAFRQSPAGWDTIVAYLARCRELGCLPRMCCSPLD